ncbi:MAG: hypothetical protein IPO58_26975 [Betaproteobacteria bacterium]|nr:hypothetical protein [Betaproteobacteria bacterium]
MDWLIATPTAYRDFCSSVAGSAARAPVQPMLNAAARKNVVIFKMNLFGENRDSTRPGEIARGALPPV